MLKIPLIALLTDFGTRDAYVGTMKGVMVGICPTAQFVDLTHAIAPQNVRQAATTLLTAYRYFPAHTVFLVVVDPGVGTPRAPIAVQTDHGTYVAPDNGVLSYVLAQVQDAHAVTLAYAAYQRDAISETFHGRDIFSPAAAHLASEVPISELGPERDSWTELAPPRLTLAADAIHGEVLHVDHFGNVITSIGTLTWTGETTLTLTPTFGASACAGDSVTLDTAHSHVQIGNHTLSGINRTYGDVSPGELTALVGSTEQLEIGVNQGHAARRLQVQPGDPVTLKRYT